MQNGSGGESKKSPKDMKKNYAITILQTIPCSHNESCWKTRWDWLMKGNFKKKGSSIGHDWKSTLGMSKCLRCATSEIEWMKPLPI